MNLQLVGLHHIKKGVYISKKIKLRKLNTNIFLGNYFFKITKVSAES